MAMAAVKFAGSRLDFLACVSDQGYPLVDRSPVIEELTTPGVDGSAFRRVRYSDPVWEFVGYSDAASYDAAVKLSAVARAIDGNSATFTGTFGGTNVYIKAAVMELRSIQVRPGKCSGGGATGSSHIVTSWRMTILAGVK